MFLRYVKGSVVVTICVDDTGTLHARRIKAICIVVTRMITHTGAELDYWLDVVRITRGSMLRCTTAHIQVTKLYSTRLKSKHNYIIICIYSRRW